MGIAPFSQARQALHRDLGAFIKHREQVKVQCRVYFKPLGRNQILDIVRKKIDAIGPSYTLTHFSMEFCYENGQYACSLERDLEGVLFSASSEKRAHLYAPDGPPVVSLGDVWQFVTQPDGRGAGSTGQLDHVYTLHGCNCQTFCYDFWTFARGVALGGSSTDAWVRQIQQEYKSAGGVPGPV